MEEVSASNQLNRPDSLFRGLIVPWLICLLAALFYTYDFILRIIPSVMIHPLMHQFSVGAAEIGLLSAFYFYSYTPLQIPSGIIIDKFDRRLVLTISAAFCAIGAFVFAYADSMAMIFIARMMMGVGSAFAFVGALKLAAAWLPPKSFALFTGLATSFGTLGAIFTDVFLSRAVHRFGWQHTSLFVAYIGLALAVLILIFVRSKPVWFEGFSEDYKSWSNIGARLWAMIKNWRLWVNGIVGALLFMPVSVFASLWGVAFLIEAHHWTPSEAASATALVFLGTAIGCPIAGWVSDKIKNRRLPILIGTVGTGLSLSALIYLNSVGVVEGLVLLFLIGFFVGPQVLVFAIAKENTPPGSTGISTSATNLLVTLSAAVFQPVIGWMLDLHWSGKLTSDGVRDYTVSDYRLAFGLLIGFLVVSFFLTYLLPRHYGRKGKW